jgi:GNAT superfamily N-acetyltransferase
MSDFEIHEAIPTDLDDFRLMAFEYLTELRTVGSEVIVSERTVEYWSDVFALYIDEPELGVVVLAYQPDHDRPLGFSMAGAASPEPSPMDTEFGKTAIGHGTYVRPGFRQSGVGQALRARVKQMLRERGFDTLVGGVHLANERGIASLRESGFIAHQILGYEKLQQSEHEQKLEVKK